MSFLNMFVKEIEESQKRQVSLIGDIILQSQITPFMQMQNSLVKSLAPIVQMQGIAEIITEPVRQIHEIIAFSPMLQAIKILDEIAESERKMIESLSKPSLFSYLSFQNPLVSAIQEAEIIEDTKQKVFQEETTETQKAVVVHQPILPVLIPIKKYVRKMGLKQISGGNFSYKRTTLKGISLRNREGQALSLILSNNDLFISDQLMKERLYANDIYEESKIIQLLKNKFKYNGLRAIILRQGDGYILIEISYLQ